MESPLGKFIEYADYKFVKCPSCGVKYKLDLNEEGHTHIKGMQDVDEIEPGMQIYCLRCGTKFTIPEVE